MHWFREASEDVMSCLQPSYHTIPMGRGQSWDNRWHPGEVKVKVKGWCWLTGTVGALWSAGCCFAVGTAAELGVVTGWSVLGRGHSGARQRGACRWYTGAHNNNSWSFRKPIDWSHVLSESQREAALSKAAAKHRCCFFLSLKTYDSLCCFSTRSCSFRFSCFLRLLTAEASVRCNYMAFSWGLILHLELILSERGHIMGAVASHFTHVAL